jgi:hypothetical protein
MENTDVLFIYGQFVIGAPLIPFPLKIAKFHYCLTEPNLKGIENFYFTSNFDAHFIIEMIVSKLYVSVMISPASLRIKWIKRLPKKYKILFFIKV